MKIQPREKGMQEYANHKGNRLCTEDAAGAAGRREALRRLDGVDGADPRTVCLSDPAKALRRGAGAGEPGRSRRLPAVP